MWAMTLWDSATPWFQWGVVVGVSVFAAVWDLRWRRIPNRLTGPVLFVGLAVAMAIGGPVGLADAAAACLMMAAPFVVLFAVGGGGAGDAKLMGALGAWLGVVNGAVVLLGVVLAGVVLAIGVAVSRGQVATVATNLAQVGRSLLLFAAAPARPSAVLEALPPPRKCLSFPYGVAIGAGVCVSAIGVLLWRG